MWIGSNRAHLALELPKIGKLFLFGLLWSLMIIALLNINDGFNITRILDITIFIFPILLAPYVTIKFSILWICILVYFCMMMFSSYYNPIGDTLVAFKWIAYFLPLLLISKIKILSFVHLRNISEIAIAIFLAKYVYQWLALGIRRPEVFNENNWELIFLLVSTFIVTVETLDYRGFYRWITLGLVCLVSGSTSAMSAYIAASILLILLRTKGKQKVQFLLIVGIASLILFVGLTTGQQIDRVFFFRVFLEEMSTQNAMNWIFGSHILRPVSTDSCLELSYYAVLFSDYDSMTCYSVIFHLGLLRVLFDFGIVGLIISYYIYYRLLDRSGISDFASISVLFLIFLNSISVAGLYSSFSAFSVLLICLTDWRSFASGRHLSSSKI